MPDCCDRPMHRHAKTKAGNIRYRCPLCGRTVTEGGTHGGYRHGKEGGTTAAERMRQMRIRKRQNSTEEPEQ